MTALLGMSYFIGLSKDEEDLVNARVKKNREEFMSGAKKGAAIALTVTSLTSVAHAKDICPTGTPGAGIEPSPSPVLPASDAFKDMLVGATGIVCGGAVQYGNYVLGALCGALVVAGIVAYGPKG